MQRACALFLLLGLSSCANTVYRMDGEFATPAGRAETACEREQWLVIAPTRAEIVPEGRKVSVKRDDGLGLYRVGQSEPESIVALKDDLTPYGAPDLIAAKAEAVQPYDSRRIIAASMGGAGTVALTIGTILFVTAFETVRSGPNNDEEQRIDKTKATTGALMVGLGLGLGIAGIAVSPSHEMRTRANADRYVFFPEDIHKKEVSEMVGGYNQRVRERCP